MTRFIQQKYLLTPVEEAELDQHPRRAAIIVEHDRWLAANGYPHPGSALSRGMLLQLVRAAPTLVAHGRYHYCGVCDLHYTDDELVDGACPRHPEIRVGEQA